MSLGFGFGKHLKSQYFFKLANETTQKRRYFKAGIRPYFLVSVFYF